MILATQPPRPFEKDRELDHDPPIVLRLMRAREKRVLLHGPYGTGKSKIALEKVRACCIKYPGSRWLMLRSVRKWLTNTALVTWEDRVVFKQELKPDRIQRANRSEYRFKNGSVVVVAGLDDPQSVLSAEYDGAFLNEANEVPFETVDILDKRLRYGRMPYQQLIMDCNPAGPMHWLYKAFNSGWCRSEPMRHTDNPAIYKKGVLTEWGAAYLARLEDMTGVRRRRYKDGEWVQSEGVVYDRFDTAIHASITKADLPSGWKQWPRIWSFDFGFNDPLVWQCWALDPDNRMFLVHELYLTQMLPEDAVDLILPAVNGEPEPLAIICDHDRAERERLERKLGMPTVAADKGILVNIDAVSERLKVGDGDAKIFFCRDALIHAPDERLEEAHHPVSTLAEFDAYQWAKNPGQKGKDLPVDRFNHGMDAMGYAVRWADERGDLTADRYVYDRNSLLNSFGPGVFDNWKIH